MYGKQILEKVRKKKYGKKVREKKDGEKSMEKKVPVMSLPVT
jgi:hypothetical protein